LKELEEYLKDMLKNPKNLRVDLTLSLIGETDASKKTCGDTLIQQVKLGKRSKEY